MTIKPEEVTDAVVQELASHHTKCWGLSLEDFDKKGATLTSLRNCFRVSFEDRDMRTKIAASYTFNSTTTVSVTHQPLQATGEKVERLERRRISSSDSTSLSKKPSG
jgi:hypothetical protein